MGFLNYGELCFLSVPESQTLLSQAETEPEQELWPWFHANRIPAEGRKGGIKLFYLMGVMGRIVSPLQIRISHQCFVLFELST